MHYAELKIQTTPHFQPLFDENHPEAKKMFKVWRGGRGAMKSWQIGRALCLKGARRKSKILCGREYQNSMAESVLALIQDQAQRIGLGEFYKSTESETVGRNGTTFSYKGLKNNITSLKSFEGATDFWIEEGQTISQNSLDIILPSIRAADAQILISYNPDAEDDPIHQFVNSLPPELVYLADVNWPDNPWLPESLRIQKDLRLRRINESTNDEERAIEQEAYDQIWMGKTRKASRARIFAGKCVQEDFRVEYLSRDTADRKQGYYINGVPADGPYFGADWGFSADPTAACRAWICNECIYIDHEIYEYRLDLDKTPEALRRIPLLDKHLTRGDCSRPETINHCRKERADSTGTVQPGLNIVSAEKWPDSVEDGITVLKGMKKIIMHPRCVNFWEEARYYSYKVDAKTGDVLADVVDKYNHLWDALRYALAPFIKRSGKGQGFYQYYSHKMAKEAN